MDTSAFNNKIIRSFTEIDASEWNHLSGTDNPFLRHEFFLALEKNGNLNHDSGWDCRIVCIFDKEMDGKLIAAMPMFLKHHSWAEFVFDWAWASAYEQHGMQYYPKLLVTTPYTPATARKCLTHPDFDQDTLSSLLIHTAMDHAESQSVSSLHAIFLNDKEKALWQQKGLMERIDCQFHWQNEWLGQEDAEFDDFLALMSSSKRKKIRQERRSLEKQGVSFKIEMADKIDSDLWPRLYECYASTFLMRGQPPYFSQELFLALANTMGEQMPVVQAWKDDELVATAICFQSNDVLYGRYWGAMEEVKNLHFEVCYYQLIEYALANKLKHIEPGTGGTHKLRRGFQPTITTSMHYIAHPGFKTAIEDHLKRERPAILAYKEDAKTHLPFKKI